MLAALAVFAGHANGIFFHFAHAGIVFGHAREAVAVFFVLSGFVIRLVMDERERTWRAFVIARVSRILPVAVLAIFITFGADMLGMYLAPHYYASLDFFVPDTITAALRYLSFTNQLWFSHVVFGTDEPYWSLSFEVWYYLLIGLWTFTLSRHRWFILALWLLVCGPKIALYFPLWALGVLTCHAYRRDRLLIKSSWAKAGFAGTFILYVVIWRLVARHAGNMYLTYSIGQEAINFAYMMSIGLVVAANILLLDQVCGNAPLLGRRICRAIRWAAGASFTLYLVHQPILTLISSAMPAAKRSVPMGIEGCALALCIVLLLAELAERRKKWFAFILQAILGRIYPAREGAFQ